MSSVLDRTVLEYLRQTSVAQVTGTVGALLTVLAVVLLAGRQVLDVALSAEQRGRLRAVDAVLVPLLFAVMVVVVTRFDQMSF